MTDPTIRATAAPAPLTASTSLRLATPSALSRGLALAGLVWDPIPWESELPGQPGLYAWVAPLEATALTACPVLYIGIGEDWVARVQEEQTWSTDEYIHGHGMMVNRTGAKAVGGPVSSGNYDLEALLSGLSPKGYGKVNSFFDKGVPEPYLHHAEHVAVRMAMHLGDVGAPVNSQYKGAWASSKSEDWVAYAASEALRR